jgi:hypothetical protein
MVHKGDDNKPKRVPALILESKEDIRRFLEAIKRKELRKSYQHELENVKTSLLVEVESEIAKLSKERCKIVLP